MRVSFVYEFDDNLPNEMLLELVHQVVTHYSNPVTFVLSDPRQDSTKWNIGKVYVSRDNSTVPQESIEKLMDYIQGEVLEKARRLYRHIESQDPPEDSMFYQ